MVNDMDYKSTVRKHGMIIAICVICSMLIIGGTSYALFFQSNINTENQVLKTGKLDVTYGNESSRITLEKLMPVSDEVGLSDSKYSSTVKIENTGSLPASYVLKLSKDLNQSAGVTNANFVNLQYVKIAVFNGQTQILGATKLSTITADEDGMYEIYTGSLAAEASENITVRIWLDSQTPETETGKYVYFKLDVSSVVDEDNTEEGQANNN